MTGLKLAALRDIRRTSGKFGTDDNVILSRSVGRVQDTQSAHRLDAANYGHVGCGRWRGRAAQVAVVACVSGRDRTVNRRSVAHCRRLAVANDRQWIDWRSRREWRNGSPQDGMECDRIDRQHGHGSSDQRAHDNQNPARRDPSPFWRMAPLPIEEAAASRLGYLQDPTAVMSALGQKRTFRHSFDYFISAQEERLWDRQTECLGAGQVDDELKPGWLFRVRRGL